MFLCRLAISVALLLAVAATGPAQAEPIAEFHQVNAHIYRGGRPDSEGLEALKKLGIKTIINLENNDDSIAWEQGAAPALGMREISVPLSGFFAPSDKQTAAVQTELNRPENYPLFIHCQHGQDRTGLMVGLYRVYTECWTPARAYAEMLTDGFHELLFPLKEYFEEKTSL